MIENGLVFKERNMKMKNYGCEKAINCELPRWVRKVIKKMKMNDPLIVPIRQSGMTSTGKEMFCHSNVDVLVREYGGERMLGYMVHKPLEMNRDVITEDIACLVPHSVWITPEGKMVDVTKREPLQLKQMFSTDKSFEFFIPITTNPNMVVRSISFANPKLVSVNWVQIEKWVGKFIMSDPTIDIEEKYEAILGFPKIKTLVHKVECFAKYHSMRTDFSKLDLFTYP